MYIMHADKGLIKVDCYVTARISIDKGDASQSIRVLAILHIQECLGIQTHYKYVKTNIHIPSEYHYTKMRNKHGNQGEDEVYNIYLELQTHRNICSSSKP